MKNNLVFTLVAIIFFFSGLARGADYDNCEDEVINGTSYCTRWNDGGSLHTGQCSCSSVGDALVALAVAGVIYLVVTKMTEDNEEEVALVSFDANNPFQLNYNGLPDWAYLNLNFSPVTYVNDYSINGIEPFKSGKNRAIVQINVGAKFK
tara:strand:- start:353 stop:802 length:450 start_codon:yes stop_codon:yes gene_type:complete